MKFKTVAEAFNYYRTMDVADLEKRAKEIDNITNTDAAADIESLNIELRGIKEARENIELRSSAAQSFNPITGRILARPDRTRSQGTCWTVWNTGVHFSKAC